MNPTQLIQAARQAAEFAYCPYSKFRVGAAILVGTDGWQKLFTGANVENASYGLTICAERAAIFSAAEAFAAGGRLLAVAVTCLDAPADSTPSGRMPCGACRQVIAEFGRYDTMIYVDEVDNFCIDRLLPLAFTL